MAADLTCAEAFRRRSLVIDENELIVLEHDSGSDRVRRILYDRVENVLTWRSVAWGRLIAWTVILGSPGALFLLLGDMFELRVVGGIFVGILGLMLARLVVCGRTTIRVQRAGQFRDFATVAGPARIRRFLDWLDLAIRARQRQEAARLNQAVAMTPGPGDAPTDSSDAPAADEQATLLDDLVYDTEAGTRDAGARPEAST